MVSRRGRACIVRFQTLDQSTRREATALRAAGYDVEVLCLRGPGEAKTEHLDGFGVRRFRMNKSRGSKVRYVVDYAAWFVVGFVWLTARHVRRRWSLIQVSTLPDLQVFATLIPRLTGAKVVVFLKEPTGELFETLYGSARIGRIMNRISDAAIRYSDLAFAVSEQHRRTYLERGLPPDKIVAIVNSMPIDVFGVTAADRHPDPERFVVMCHGTIEERWGHETIVRAAALARPDLPELTIRFTGSGGYTDEMLALADELGVRDIIDYQGFLPWDELGRQLMTADVGVSAQVPSAYSHVVQTGKMYEYLALGIPVIVTRLESNLAYFEQGQVWFVEPEDPQAMADAFVHLARHRDELDALAVAGAEAFHPYRWDAQADRYVGAILEIDT